MSSNNVRQLHFGQVLVESVPSHAGQAAMAHLTRIPDEEWWQ